jgi:hypothetical protein
MLEKPFVFWRDFSLGPAESSILSSLRIYVGFLRAVKSGFFLRKKARDGLLSVYSDSQIALQKISEPSEKIKNPSSLLAGAFSGPVTGYSISLPGTNLGHAGKFRLRTC